MFEAAYSLGEHVTGEEEKELPALTPVLRWKKGQKIAQKNQVPETRDWDPRWQVYVHNNSPGGMGARGWAHPLLGLPFPIYSTRGLVFIKSSTARTLGDSIKAQPACGPLLFCPCVCIIISSQAHPFPDSLTDMAQEVQGALHA